MEVFLPIVRMDYRLAESCTPKTNKINCSASIFGGSHDKGVPVESLAEWQDSLSAKSEVHIFEGDHFFLYNKTPFEKIHEIVEFFGDQ